MILLGFMETLKWLVKSCMVFPAVLVPGLAIGSLFGVDDDLWISIIKF